MIKCGLAIVGVFPPYGGAGAVRLVKLFRYLRFFGWRIDVIAPAGRAGWFVDEDLAAEARDLWVWRIGSTRHRGGLGERLRATAKDGGASFGWSQRVLAGAMSGARGARDRLAYPDEYLLWAGQAFIEGSLRLATRSYDVVFTSSFPYSCHLAGYALQRVWHLPWLMDLRDPWAGHRFRGHDKGAKRWLDEKLEQRMLRAAAAVTVALPHMPERLESLYGSWCREKITVATNGYDPRDYSALVDEPDTEVLRLLYVGSFDAALTPIDGVLAAIDRVIARRPSAREHLRLEVVGGTDLVGAHKLRQWRARSRGADVVSLLGHATHNEAIRAMRRAGALVLTVGSGEPWVLPSKTFEYVAAGRPILAMAPAGAVSEILQRFDGIEVINPNDADSMAQAILRILDDGVRTEALPRPPSSMDDFAVPSLAGRVAAILDGIII